MPAEMIYHKPTLEVWYVWNPKVHPKEEITPLMGNVEDFAYHTVEGDYNKILESLFPARPSGPKSWKLSADLKQIIKNPDFKEPLNAVALTEKVKELETRIENIEGAM